MGLFFPTFLYFFIFPFYLHMLSGTTKKEEGRGGVNHQQKVMQRGGSSVNVHTGETYKGIIFFIYFFF